MSELVEIVLDTETTGIGATDRIIEIGAIKLINRKITKHIFHSYVNPECKVSDEAYRIHGISNEFLTNKPAFKEIAKDFLDFIGTNHKIIIHNAPFDKRFINNELVVLGLPLLEDHRIIDTLIIARKKFPGSGASLDALCKRYNISLESREKHGALLDSELLANVYTMMCGYVQSDISNLYKNIEQNNMDERIENIAKYNKRKFHLSEQDKELHENFIQNIKSPVWNNYK